MSKPIDRRELRNPPLTSVVERQRQNHLVTIFNISESLAGTIALAHFGEAHDD